MHLQLIKSVILFLALFGLVISAPLFGASPGSETPEALSFYIVSHEAAGETIDDSTIVSLRTKGFISNKADLVVHELQSIEATQVKSTQMNLDNTPGKTEIREALVIHFKPDDAKKFSNLTTKGGHYQILVLLNGKYLMAPFVGIPILTNSFQVTFPKNDDVESIKKQFDLLVTK